MSRRTAHVSAVTLSALVLAGLGTTAAHAATAAPAVADQAIDFVASASKAANVQVAKVVVPATVQPGDTLLLTASLGNTTSVVGPKGWTLKGDQSAPLLRSMVWTRTAVAGDAGSTVSVTLDAIHKSALAVTAYRGVDATTPVAVSSSADANTGTHLTPDTRTPVGAKVVSVWTERGNSTTAWNVAGPAVRTAAYSTGSGRVSAAVADAGVDPSTARTGATGSATGTTNAVSAQAVNWSIVLPAPNVAPTAGMTKACTDVTCTVDGTSSADGDGTVASYRWDFGDGATSTGTTGSHTYAQPGTYTITLTVTDDDGATSTTSAQVSVDRATVFGMNVSPGTSFTNGVRESAGDQVNRVVSTYGGLGAAKIFYSGNLPTTFNQAYEGLVPGKTVAVCFKPNQAALASGQLDAGIKSYLDSVPAGWKVMLVNWQEPDDEMWKDGVFTVAQHRAATEHLIDVVRGNAAYADDRAEVWEVFMGFSLDVNRFQDAVVSPRLDGIGWDYYWNKPVTDWSTDPSIALKKMADRTQALGIKDWGLFETGDNPHLNDLDGSGRAGFWTKVYTTAKSLRYHFVLYFNAIGTTGDHRILPDTSFGGSTVSALRSFMAPKG